jgi:predicted ATPase
LTREHPLKAIKQELQLHGHCQDLALDFLSEGAVAEYLVQRFLSSSSTDAGEGRGEGLSQAAFRRLAHLIHQRTDGNPLFMVNVVEHLLSQGVLSQREGQWVLKNEELTATVPESLRQMIEQRLTQVSPQARTVLEVASVAGAEFSAAAVAAGVETTGEAIEEQCAALARREQFLRARGTSEWPDGTIAARYGFVHALYQEVLYEQIPASRRTRLHRQIGEREEAGYGDRAREIAAELAVHFEQGRDYRKAVEYRQQAGENAQRRNANQGAADHFIAGLELLKHWPQTAERAQHELTLLTTLGPVLSTTRGYGAAEVERVYLRAQDLVQQTGDSSREFLVLSGLLILYRIQGKHQLAYEFGKRFLSLAQRKHDSVLLIQAHYTLAVTLFYLEDLNSAQEHLDQALALYDEQEHRSLALLYGQDPRVPCLLFAGHTLWSLMHFQDTSWGIERGFSYGQPK